MFEIQKQQNTRQPTESALHETIEAISTKIQQEMKDPHIYVKIGLSGLAGLISGVLTKHFGRIIITTVSSGFLVIKALTFMDYVQVKEDKIKQDLQPIVNKKTVKGIFTTIRDFALSNLVVALSFTAGVFIALR